MSDKLGKRIATLSKDQMTEVSHQAQRKILEET
jgi:hypothetical protein